MSYQSAYTCIKKIVKAAISKVDRRVGYYGTVIDGKANEAIAAKIGNPGQSDVCKCFKMQEAITSLKKAIGDGQSR